MYVTNLCIITACLCSFLHAADEGLTARRDNLPAGDPGRCLTSENSKVFRFEVLPGGGWDNLRNTHAGLVLARNYSLCQTTEDGRFLLPDGIYTIPIKSSDVDTYAELFEHWDNYTSTFSRTINVHAGLSLSHVSISGKFSDEYQSVKSDQYYSKSATTRMQARYGSYTAKVQPDTSLTGPFRARLRKIAANKMLNNTDLARYESQLLVRDFGTHVITSVDAGAALVQHDQILEAFVRKDESEKHTILASASASFFGIFSFGADYSQTTTKQHIEQYKSSRIKSKIQTHGGPRFKPLNFTADNWIADMDNNLVAIDIAGDPIYYVITESTLPDLPADAVYDVYALVKDAVDVYFKHNTYRGCMNTESPNFSFQANVDDGSCKPPNTNFTFGGVYQTCDGSGFTNLCVGQKLEQKNPLTGACTCQDGYEAVLLNGGSKTSTTNRRECHGWWIFKRCKDVTYYASAKYNAYWCAASGPVKKNHGFQFGGLYTSKTNNPLTASPSCPVQFYPLHVLGLIVCVSDDYELGAAFAVPFAGFYSCKSGNPLALEKFGNTDQTLRDNGQRTLMTYMLESGAATWPKSCPDGYSQHLAMVDNECEINYCVKAGVFSHLGLPNVQRPPFMERPNNFKDLAEVAFTSDGTEWITIDNDSDQLTLSEYVQQFMNPAGKSSAKTGSGNDGSGSGISGAGIAGISVGATLACVFVTTVIVIAIRRRRRARSNLYRNTDPWDGSGERQPVVTGSHLLYSGNTAGENVLVTHA